MDDHWREAERKGQKKSSECLKKQKGNKKQIMECEVR